jgi:hypothetical protein
MQRLRTQKGVGNQVKNLWLPPESMTEAEAVLYADLEHAKQKLKKLAFRMDAETASGQRIKASLRAHRDNLRQIRGYRNRVVSLRSYRELLASFDRGRSALKQHYLAMRNCGSEMEQLAEFIDQLLMKIRAARYRAPVLQFRRRDERR